MTKRTCRYVLRWLRYFVSEKIESFPEACVKNNGQPIYDMLNKLTADSYIDLNVTLIKDTTIDRVKVLGSQYASLIKRLKEEGCLLNHIRPEYLLSLNDYL
jgi:lipoate-protein ligase A